jgi:hypothetical protein
MNSLIFKALTLLGSIGLFIFWGLNNAYPQ